jgi:Putative transposase DNA-binding domain
VIRLAVELGQFGLEVGADIRVISSGRPWWRPAKTACRCLVTKTRRAGNAETPCLPVRTPMSVAINMVITCSFVTTTAFTQTALSARRWPGRSGTRGWCSTTRWQRGGPRTRPGTRTSPMRRCPPGSPPPSKRRNGHGSARCRRWCSSVNVREWTCGQCGAVHDRDVNAAKNILALGRRERLNAREGQVRPAATRAPASEAGSRRSAA